MPTKTPQTPATADAQASAEAQRTHAPSEVGGKETTPAARVKQPTDERVSPRGHDVTVDRTNPYPGIEYGPEVDAALEAVFEAQEALREAALQAKGKGFSIWEKSLNREAYMLSIEEPRRALQQANERLDELSVRACQKAGCYDF